MVRSLSRRELVILRTLTEGASNKIIARKLVITELTVKVHMKAILRKLRLQNRTQAAIWARTHLGAAARKTPLKAAHRAFVKANTRWPSCLLPIMIVLGSQSGRELRTL